MSPFGLKQMKYGERLRLLADGATGPDRTHWLEMAASFGRSAEIIEQSIKTIAESRALLAAADRLLLPPLCIH
jgi:hypothetical protein